MTEKTIKVYARACQLNRAGNDWEDVPKLLAADGFVKKDGSLYSWRSVKNECSRNAKAIDEFLASSRGQAVPPADQESTPMQETSSASASMDTEKLKELIREVSRQVFEEMVHSRMKDHVEPPTTLELPPEPQRITTKTKRDGKLRGKGGQQQESRKFDRMTITIDKLLLPHVKAAMRELRLPSISKTLEVLAWNALGRPRLSYQDAPPVEPEASVD